MSQASQPQSIWRDTTYCAALSGGTNRATSLSLNAFPYRAQSVLHRRLRVPGFMKAKTILRREAPQLAAMNSRSCNSMLFIDAAICDTSVFSSRQLKWSSWHAK